MMAAIVGSLPGIQPLYSDHMDFLCGHSVWEETPFQEVNDVEWELSENHPGNLVLPL
ncbi:hypothetical protein L798_09791 [Zootermopsis nevadensis]|uniref:Uncharacterized protein n=1 Tax=Zootermopsis nevadensis TaxID=136037 RepID=A0A067R194_ZOONE|nr:hypothetical protein L798_09791 [Zootermopsis nevadensis]